MKFTTFTEKEESLGRAIVNAAFKVHTELGPGLLEKVCEICLAHELRKLEFVVARQIDISIQYDGIVFEEGLRLDLLVENSVVIEVKSVEILNPVWHAQVLSQFKTSPRLSYQFQCASNKKWNHQNRKLASLASSRLRDKLSYYLIPPARFRVGLYPKYF